MDKNFVELQEETLEIEGGYMVGALDGFSSGADYAAGIGAGTGEYYGSCAGAGTACGGH